MSDKNELNKHQVTKEELASLKEAFELYDTDKNDAINVEQFADILKSLKIESDSTKLEKLVEKVDKNHDGQIDFDEFVSAMTSLWGNSPESENTSEQKKHTPQRSYTKRMSTHDSDDLRQCFEKFDTNGDGTISFDELKEVMNGLGEKLSEQELKDMMTDADTNKNGLIDFDEFKALIPSA